MKIVLHNLIELQRIDNRLYELEELRGDLPFQVKNLEDQINSLSKENTEKSDKIIELDSDLRKINSSTDDNQVKLKHYKDQLYLVTTNKEYDALLSEIDTMKNNIQESEENIIKFEEEKTELTDLIKRNELKIESFAENLKNSKEELNKSLSDTEAEERELSQRRTEFAKKIDTNYINNYEKVKVAREGIAVSPISR